mgnify:CR=1 FL=1
MSEIPTEIIDRIIYHLTWMIEERIIRHEDTGIECKYSEELEDAIKLLEELIG